MKGSLVSIRPDDLTVQMVRAALDKVPALNPHQIDDLILGCGLPGGEQGFNMARVVAVALGYDFLPGTTVNRYCSSSLQTTRMAFHAIKAGEGDAFISAGVETVSRFAKGNSDSLAGHQEPAVRRGPGALRRGGRRRRRMARPARGRKPARRLHRDGPDRRERRRSSPASAARSRTTGECAARTAPRRRSRAGSSNARSPRSPCPDGTTVSTDDGPRAGTTYEKVSELKPVFRPNGTVTAGNACPLNDGAAALVITSDTKAKELGLTPLARIVSTGVSGLSPEIMGLGPIEASKKALARAGMSIGDIDLFEINEAFAVQVLGSARELGIDEDKLNVSGGAIALGHPFGMTGARIATTLLNNLKTHDKTLGLETMCVGGGQGMAMVLERLS